MIDAGAHSMVHLADRRLFPLARLVIFTRHPAIIVWRLVDPAGAGQRPLLTRLGDLVGTPRSAMALWA